MEINNKVSVRTISAKELGHTEGWFRGTGSRKGYMYYSNGKGMVMQSVNEDFTGANPFNLSDNVDVVVEACSAPFG